MMHSMQFFSFTSDAWTTHANRCIHWCSMTLHFINESWCLKKLLLDITQLEYSSNNVEISNAWNTTFLKYKMKLNCLSAVVLDGGGNFQKAGRSLAAGTPALVYWCACHRLHLVTKFLFKNGPDLLLMLFKKCSNILAKFSRSFQFSYTLQIQQAKYNVSRSLVQPISVRWNSSFNMFASIFENKEPLIATLIEEGEDDLGLTDNEWFLLEFIVPWSEAITKSINTLQSDTRSTIDLVYVQLQILHNEAEDLDRSKPVKNQVNAFQIVDFKKKLGKTLKDALNNYFPEKERIYHNSNKNYSEKKNHFLVLIFFLFGIMEN